MPAPAGAIVGITYDADPGVTVEPTHVLVTPRGRVYLVVSARRQNSRVAPNRYSLRCMVLSESGVPAHHPANAGRVVHRLVFNPRGPK